MRVSTTIDIRETTTFYVFDCDGCGIVFGVPQDWIKHRQEDGGPIYCPNGHSMSYGGTRQKLERELENARASLASVRASLASERARREQEQRGHAATRGHLTRVKRRVEAGVCIHCHRTFQQLAKHMQSRHGTPESAAAAAAEAKAERAKG